MPKLDHLLKWINILLILVTFLTYLAPYVSPAYVWGFSFLALVYPWLLLGNLIFILFWAIQKNKYFLFSLGCLIVGWGHFRSFVGLTPGNETGREDDITVMSFNCHRLEHMGPGDRVIDKELLLEMIDKHSPDVLSMQEFPSYDPLARKFIKIIKEETNLKYHYRTYRGTLAMFSRFPIADKKQKYFPNQANGYQLIDLDINGDKIRLFNVHLQTNAVSRATDRIASEGQFDKKETWLDIKGMAGRFRRAIKIRAGQAEHLTEVIAESPYPVIVNGDFNDVPLSYTYRQLSQNLQDSFKKKGGGLGTTYSGKIPALRIDYILADPAYKILDHRTIRGGYSDHYPVCSVMKLP